MHNFSFSRAINQIKALPPRLKFWLLWLIVTTLVIPLLMRSNSFFSSMLICQAGNLVFGTPLMLRFGLVKLLGLSHLIFWTPILALFVWHYSSLNSDVLVSCGWIAVVSVVASLILDFRDFRDWLRDDRTPVGEPAPIAHR